MDWTVPFPVEHKLENSIRFYEGSKSHQKSNLVREKWQRLLSLTKFFSKEFFFQKGRYVIWYILSFSLFSIQALSWLREQPPLTDDQLKGLFITAEDFEVWSCQTHFFLLIELGLWRKRLPTSLPAWQWSGSSWHFFPSLNWPFRLCIFVMTVLEVFIKNTFYHPISWSLLLSYYLKEPNFK